MSRTRLVALGALAVTAVCVAPSGASAAVLQANQPCYLENEPITLSGSGYDPNQSFQITEPSSAVYTSGTTDATGAFTAMVNAPLLGVASDNPTTKSFTLTGAEDANPAQTAQTTIHVANHTVGITPSSGKPTQKVTYRFSGFAPGKHVYGHYRYHAKTIRTVDFGVTAQPCGTKKVRGRRIPVTHPHTGTWKLQIDNQKKYVATASERIIYSITVTRTFHF